MSSFSYGGEKFDIGGTGSTMWTKGTVVRNQKSNAYYHAFPYVTEDFQLKWCVGLNPLFNDSPLNNIFKQLKLAMTDHGLQRISPHPFFKETECSPEMAQVITGACEAFHRKNGTDTLFTVGDAIKREAHQKYLFIRDQTRKITEYEDAPNPRLRDLAKSFKAELKELERLYAVRDTRLENAKTTLRAWSMKGWDNFPLYETLEDVLQGGKPPKCPVDGGIPY